MSTPFEFAMKMGQTADAVKTMPQTIPSGMASTAVVPITQNEPRMAARAPPVSGRIWDEYFVRTLVSSRGRGEQRQATSGGRGRLR